MKEINGSSEKISKIIRVIDEIAFQTNILALNAAVVGFGAQRSAEAARGTARLIEESIAKSNVGSAELDVVAESVRKITGGVTRVKALADEVDGASQNQVRGGERIAVFTGQMEQVTQKNAASAERSAAAGKELASHSQSLLALADRLQNLSGSSAAPEPTWALSAEKAVRPRVRILASMPGRAAAPLDEDKAAN